MPNVSVDTRWPSTDARRTIGLDAEASDGSWAVVAGLLGPGQPYRSLDVNIFPVFPGPFPRRSRRWYTVSASKTDRPMSLQESLRALPPDQKLAIVTELWDDLAASAPLTLPEDELAEMSRRRDELLANPEIAIDADEAWRRVDGD